MCGIAGLLGAAFDPAALDAMVAAQRHRGPDASGTFVDAEVRVALGHDRLRILDLSVAGDQPMTSADGRHVIVFNGEVYNHQALRGELAGIAWRSSSDTETVLEAYARWGADCLSRFVGMFAFAIWDRVEGTLFAARDRFGVKPFLYAETPGGLRFASEPGALGASGLALRPDDGTWATYLATGRLDDCERTFWAGVCALPGGHALTWSNGRVAVRRWYDLAEEIGPDFDERSVEDVIAAYAELLEESVRLRFLSDVAVGVNLSGGLDSSVLLGTVRRVLGSAAGVEAFTFVCGDPDYDELPWVETMIEACPWRLHVARLAPRDVPELAADVQRHQGEPFGGMPTLAYAKLFEEAAAAGVTVLLDGQGMDEQWAGYDTYRRLLEGGRAGVVQGTISSPVRPGCLVEEFRALARAPGEPSPFPDPLRNAQYRDAFATKIPRALRFNDRVSMRVSRELREPFLDHRLFELAFRQVPERKIDGAVSKVLLRELARRIVPDGVRLAPKRALQTPQREWLRGPLADWARQQIDVALSRFGGMWFDAAAVRREAERYFEEGGENSFYLWQWINVGLMEPAFAEGGSAS